jgi:hypothetical protein
MDNDKIRNEQASTPGNDEPSLDESGSDFKNAPRGEESVGYRIAAMIAMLLLAMAGVLFYFFARK